MDNRKAQRLGQQQAWLDPADAGQVSPSGRPEVGDAVAPLRAAGFDAIESGRDVRMLKDSGQRLKDAKFDPVGSTGRRNGSLQHIGWRLIAKGFPGPGVELESDGVEVVLTVAR